MTKHLLSFFLLTSVVFSLFSQQQMDSKTITSPIQYRVGEWLSSDQQILDQWMTTLIIETDANQKPLLPVVQELKDLIEGDPELFMLFHQMFDQVPRKAHYNNNPAGKPQVRDYQHMLQLINQIMTKAPEFNESGLVGFPINAIIDWPMGTEAGASAFLNPKLNAQLKKLLNQWAVFLDSPDSRYVLSDDPRSGWFGEDAQKAIPDFAEKFICDPKLPHYGFTSWDDFFTRQFRVGQRPLAEPTNDAIIANACESAPYRLATNVKKRDKFWIKAQPYSIEFMLNGDPLAEQFVGGTVYQAFLSAFAYHRWHSPVSGTIVKTEVVDGTYYAEAISEGFDPSGPNESQGFITEVATRGIVYIQADNPDIGLMCVMFVGMAEVSTCDFTVYEGQHVKKGDELGMFHFGGSTHCLIFRPEVKLEFDLHGQKPGLNSSNILVKSRIATVVTN